MNTILECNLILEAEALREYGILGRTSAMGNALFAISYRSLPEEAISVISLIERGGPFPYKQDGKVFKNLTGDLPAGSSRYLEFTVPTPVASNPGSYERGARRIVARHNGLLFFTACHYDRVPGKMTADERRAKTLTIDPDWRNGFYVITGMTSGQRARIKSGVAQLTETFLSAWTVAPKS